MGTRRAAAALLLVLGACAGPATDGAPAPERRLSWERTPGHCLALLEEGRVLWRFHHDPAAPHTFFHPLALPGTDALTRDRPADHVWHHGLWFSWKYIDGVNYWEHAAGADRPAGRTRWTSVDVDAREDFSARVHLRLEYAPDDSAQPVLAEERVVEVSPPAADGGYRIDWTSRFTVLAERVVLDRTPLPGEPGGQVYGGYAGLSLRLADLDQRAAATPEGPVEFNAQDRFRTRSPAMDYSGLSGGTAAGIAVLDHPKNLNAPSPWYAIRSGSMSFFSPAVICLAPVQLQRGEEFTLRYRVIVHPGRWGRERLALESQRFSSHPDDGEDRRP